MRAGLASVQLRAVKPIAEGEEITLTYLDAAHPIRQRIEMLRSGYFFECSCRECTPVVGQVTRTQLLDAYHCPKAGCSGLLVDLQPSSGYLNAADVEYECSECHQRERGLLAFSSSLEERLNREYNQRTPQRSLELVRQVQRVLECREHGAEPRPRAHQHHYLHLLCHDLMSSCLSDMANLRESVREFEKVVETYVRDGCHEGGSARRNGLTER